MKRILPYLFLFFLSAASPLSAEEGETLRIFAPKDFLPPYILNNFQEEAAIKVVLDFYEKVEALEKVLASGTPVYDAIILPASFLDYLQPKRMTLPLEKDSLNNYQNLEPFFLEKLRVLDPENEMALPYLWDAPGFLYDRNLFASQVRDIRLSGWDNLFDPQEASKLAHCGIHIPDAPLEILAGLHSFMVGREHARSLPHDEERLQAIMPSIRNVGSPKGFLYGAFCFGMGGQSALFDIMNEAARDVPPLGLKFLRPEGGLLKMEVIIIPYNARRPRAAHALLDFLLRADVAAAITSQTGYATPNRAAQDFLDEEIRFSPILNPDVSALAFLEMERGLPAQNFRNIMRVWNGLVRGKRKRVWNAPLSSEKTPPP